MDSNSSIKAMVNIMKDDEKDLVPSAPHVV